MVTPGTPPVPHVGGPVVKGSFNVLTGKIPQARVTDQCVCVGPPDVIVKGSPTVLVNKLPAARLGDNTAHGGVITVGLPTVLIGEAGAVTTGSLGFSSVTLPLGLEGSGASPAAMAKAMIAAAKDGVPFCEQCMKA
ncbi:MAG: PAAR domain-containing protein [Novosphingobium sp.]|nr:PAAR domain-containing protein [Novosphingobium sp.]MCP5389918.1 PAAR domain-containing protein [Novosphingobium sp.]